MDNRSPPSVTGALRKRVSITMMSIASRPVACPTLSFLDLPLEVRLLIYAQFLRNRRVLVRAGRQTSIHTPCSTSLCKTERVDQEEGRVRAVFRTESRCWLHPHETEQALEMYALLSVNHAVRKEVEPYYLRQNEFWIYNLDTLKVFARKELHRKHVAKMILFYGRSGTADWIPPEKRFGDEAYQQVRLLRTAARKDIVPAAVALLGFQRLNSLTLKIDSSTVCSSFPCHKLRIHGEKQLLQLRNVDLRVRYAEDLHHYHPEESFLWQVSDDQRHQFSHALETAAKSRTLTPMRTSQRLQQRERAMENPCKGEEKTSRRS